MSDYSVSSSPGNLASSHKPHIFDLVLSTGRWCLEEEQQRMRRDPEEIEEVALPQVYNDPGPKRNQKLHLVRDVKSRGTLSATLSPAVTRGFVFVHKSNGGCWYWMRDDRTPTVCLLLVCDCCLPKGSDESKSPYLEGVNVDSEAAVELLNEFIV